VVKHSSDRIVLAPDNTDPLKENILIHNKSLLWRLVKLRQGTVLRFSTERPFDTPGCLRRAHVWDGAKG